MALWPTRGSRAFLVSQLLGSVHHFHRAKPTGPVALCPATQGLVPPGQRPLPALLLSCPPLPSERRERGSGGDSLSNMDAATHGNAVEAKKADTDPVGLPSFDTIDPPGAPVRGGGTA